MVCIFFFRLVLTLRLLAISNLSAHQDAGRFFLLFFIDNI